MKNLFTKLAILAATGFTCLAATIPAAQAATVAGNFNVTATVSSVCTMAGVGDLAFGTYTAFQGAPLPATPTDAVLTCTRGLTGVLAAFDTGTDKTSSGNLANPTGAGVVAGLNYTLSATRTATAAGTAADATTIGTAATWTYSIGGSIPAGQAGTCATGDCSGTQARILTVTY